MGTTEPDRTSDDTDGSDHTGREADRPGFASAMQELNTIVAELESDALDVDHLAERVARAAELVLLCRERIDGARFAVDEILSSMDELPDTTPEEP
jgi:exodeoxyribonuclease VII small subunit